MPRLGGSEGDDERGAILIFTALLLVVLMGFAALAVDAGNAWSTRRLAQNSADLATLSAIESIPHTLDETPGSGEVEIAAVSEEVDRIVVVNTETNECDPGCASFTVDLDFDELDQPNEPDLVELEVQVVIDAPNAFAGAIGAGESTTVSADAVAEIVINHPELPLLPLGFASSTPSFQCLLTHTSVPLGCKRNVDLLAFHSPLTTPDCQERGSTTTHNLMEGMGFLVDTDGGRSAETVCNDSHPLTMPTGVRLAFDPGEDESHIREALQEGLADPADGRLQGNTVALWDLLPDSAPPLCDPVIIGTDIDLAGPLMETCLRTPGLEFDLDLGDWEPRLVWGLVTGTRGGTTFQSYVPIWLHTFVDDDGNQFLTPPPPDTLTGFTFFVLPPGTLPEELVDEERDPGGLDNVEYRLVD